MIDFRPIFYIVGILLITLGGTMMLPALVDLISGDADWRVFTVSACITMVTGLTLYLSSQESRPKLSIRQMFLLTNLSWLALCTFAAIPFTLSSYGISYTDAFFESMSGLTTTGSTVLQRLDGLSGGLLLWRALLQWLGGIGIIVMGIIVMPNLQVGGMQLFRMESSEQSDKALPRTVQNAAGVGMVYVSFTSLCALAYWFSGLSPFNAVTHSMTTVATGGFSTLDSSAAGFENPSFEWICILFMILSALPFILYVRSLRAYSYNASMGEKLCLFRDSQVQWFFGVLCTAILFIFITLNVQFPDIEIFTALRLAAFNVVSVMTGTGFATADYGTWGGFSPAFFFFLIFVGGCAGSTSCGIKIFRFQVLYATAKLQLKKLLQPNGVFIPYYNGKKISDEVSTSVMGFFYLFIVSFAALAMALGLLGLDFMTSISAAATAISNVGPGLGATIGPAGTFAPLPDEAKWLLSLGMLLGRLELFTFFVLLVPSFWRQ